MEGKEWSELSFIFTRLCLIIVLFVFSGLHLVTDRSVQRLRLLEEMRTNFCCDYCEREVSGGARLPRASLSLVSNLWLTLLSILFGLTIGWNLRIWMISIPNKCLIISYIIFNKFNKHIFLRCGFKGRPQREVTFPGITELLDLC